MNGWQAYDTLSCPIIFTLHGQWVDTRLGYCCIPHPTNGSAYIVQYIHTHIKYRNTVQTEGRKPFRPHNDYCRGQVGRTEVRTDGRTMRYYVTYSSSFQYGSYRSADSRHHMWRRTKNVNGLHSRTTEGTINQREYSTVVDKEVIQYSNVVAKGIE